MSGNELLKLTSGGGAIVNPIAGSLTGDITGTLMVDSSEGSVEVDAVFEAVLSEADSVKLLNCFHVAALPTGTSAAPVDFSDVAIDGVEIIGAKAQDFKDVVEGALTSVIENPSSCAGDADSASRHTLASYYAEVVRDSINAHLKGNATVLSSAIMRTIAVDFDKAAGAADLETNVAAADTALANMFKDIPAADKAAYLASVLTRNPEGAAGANGPAAVTDLACLPMKGGKSVTFIFNVKVGDVASMDVYANGSVGDAIAPSWDSQNDERKVAIVMHLGIKDMYFQREYDPVDVAALVAAQANKELYGRTPLRAFYAGLISNLGYTLRVATGPSGAAGPSGAGTLAADLADAATAVGDATTALASALTAGADAISTAVAAEINAAATAGAAYSPIQFIDPATAAALTTYDATIEDSTKTAAEKEAARTALQGALAADRYLSDTNKEFIRTALQGAAAAIGGYRANAGIQASEAAIVDAVVSFNDAVQDYAKLGALSDYYTESKAAAEAALKLDRESLTRPVATDAAGNAVVYQATLTSGVFNADGSVAQHPAATTIA